MPIPQRKEAFSDPAVRARLRRGAELAGARRAELADWGGHLICETFDPAQKGLAGRTVGEVAADERNRPLDTLLDVAVADDLRTVVMPPVLGLDEASWALRASVWRDEHVLLGASDAGAHMDMLATYSFATMLLSEGVRDRKLLALEEAIRLITDWPARHFGLRHRGRVAEGFHADLVVFDPATIGPGIVTTRHDLPAGAGRCSARPPGSSTCSSTEGRSSKAASRPANYRDCS